WKPGAIVNVGLKSGTNSYHGTAYAYGRDGAWDANNFFVNASGSKPAPVALEQFGATFGGPIKKDKLFYFLSFEDQRYSLGATGQITSPITAPGVGVASGNNMIASCLAVPAAGRAPLSLQMAGLDANCNPIS